MSTNEVILRDLQTLLQNSIGKQVTVIDYKTELLLPKGENYASTMLKVDATIKRTKNSAEEKLPLVAKMIPTSEFQRNHFNATASFSKEIFMLDNIAKVYKEFEKEVGIPDEEIVDLWPKCYGGRLSLKDGNELADEDAVMVMENLKLQGYDTVDRIKGLNFEQSKLAISELAHYHALGMAVRIKKPDLFEEMRKIVNIFPFHIADNEFDEVGEHTIKAICEDPRYAKFETRMRASFEKDKNLSSLSQFDEVGPWITIVHGDFWVNNILFRKDKDGTVNKVKFVDFQISRTHSPMKDLPYFMCANINPRVAELHFDDLLHVYYEKFIEYLERFDVDTSQYSRKNFDEQLKKDAENELFHCLMAVKFFTIDVKKDELDLENMIDSIMLSKGSDTYMDRCGFIVSKFVEKGWI